MNIRILYNPLVRNLRGVDRLELFIISAVATIVCVRLFLELTGYPQVGGSKLHVAHVLWGGLLMAIGIMILFTMLGKLLEAFGTLVGGIGFGLFIDEVGKFVTKDNDYFFKPSVAIMYSVFILLYLGARWLLTSKRFSANEYLVNSLNEMREIPMGNRTDEEKQAILYSLRNSDDTSQFVSGLKLLVSRMETQSEGQRGIYVRMRDALFAWYRRIADSRWFPPLVIAFFVIQFLTSLLFVAAILFDAGEVMSEFDKFTFSDWAVLASDAISAIFIAWGILVLRRSRLKAFRMFERSVLVQILIGQMFLFYQDEFGAAPGFIFYLLLFLALRFMIQREQSRQIEEVVRF